MGAGGALASLFFRAPCVQSVSERAQCWPGGTTICCAFSLVVFLGFWWVFFPVGLRFFFLEFLRSSTFLFLFFKRRKLLVRRRKTHKPQWVPFKCRVLSWWFSQRYWEGEDVKSPKETAMCIFALSSQQNCSLMLWISKYLFPGAIMRGCTRNQVTQLTKKSLKLQSFVFILLKYLHCDANADFQSKISLSPCENCCRK